MEVSINVRMLSRICNPFVESPWGVGLVSTRMVSNAIREGRFSPSPVPVGHDAPVSQHEARIAYLVVHGWKDAIEIDVGVPAMQCNISWIVSDGNHRLGAAIFKKDKAILAYVSGDLDYASEILGIDNL